jgi:excisionase family DNA binding protein
MEKITYTIQEAANAGPIGKSKIYALINEGVLPARKIGRRTFILAVDYRRLLEGLPPIPVGPAGAK